MTDASSASSRTGRPAEWFLVDGAA